MIAIPIATGVKMSGIAPDIAFDPLMHRPHHPTEQAAAMEAKSQARLRGLTHSDAAL